MLEKLLVSSIVTQSFETNNYKSSLTEKTGFVTTTRVTHATPAGLYAHTNSREWECDSQVPLANRKECKDIARQLIEDDPGRNARVRKKKFPRPFIKHSM